MSREDVVTAQAGDGANDRRKVLRGSRKPSKKRYTHHVNDHTESIKIPFHHCLIAYTLTYHYTLIICKSMQVNLPLVAKLPLDPATAR